MQNKPSLEMLQLCFDNSPMATQVMSPDGKFAYVNSAFTDIWKVTLEDLGDQNIFDDKIIQLKDVLHLVKRALKGESIEFPLTPIITYKSPDKTIWIRTKTYPLFNDDNEISYIVVMHEDVTKRKQIGKALKESEKLLNTIINFLPAYVWLKDVDGIFLTCNNNFEQFYGATRKEIVGKTDYDFVPKELADFFRKKDIEAITKGHESINEEEVTLASTGKKILFETTKKPIYDSDGNLVGVLGIGKDITERKHADETLRISEARLKNAQRIGHVWNWEYNLETKEFWTSEEGNRLYGFDPKSKNHTTEEVENCIPERERVHQALVDLIEQDAPYDLVFDIIRYDTEEKRTIHSLAILERDENNTPIKVTGVILDITEIKKSEEQLRLNNFRYKQAQKLGHVGNWEYDLVTNMYWGSEETKRIWGFSVEEEEFSPEVIEESLVELDRVGKTFNDLIQFNKPYDIIFDIKIHDSETIQTLHAIAVRETDDLGIPIKVIGTVQDITELIKVKKEVSNTNQRLKLATESADIGIWDLDLTNNELIWDERMLKFYGIKRDDFNNQYTDWESRVHPDDLPHAIVEFDAAIKGDREFNTIFRILRPNKETRFLEASAVVIWDENQKPVRMTGVNIDITDRVNIENELEKHRMHLEELVSERTVELQEAIKEMESFSYSVSHDLRAPLRAISGFCSYLVEDYRDKLDEEGQRLLKVITDNAVRMDLLITDILNLSKVSRAEIKTTETDMETFALSTYLAIATDVEQSEFEFIVNEMPKASCDPKAIKQIWSNLITNSLKYSSQSEIKRIEIGSYEKEEYHVFYIKDQGVGFDQQYERKLFGVFQRLHNLQDFSGNGVGLAIVERLVKKHGGQIWGEGEVGKGATFYFSLPKK